MHEARGPLRVLIVDDDARIRRSIDRLVRSDIEVVEVGEASDAESALAMTERERWDVVLLDLSFPGMSGLDALRALRARGEDVAVIVVSGLPVDPYHAAALAAGANACIQKERAPEELRPLLRSLVASPPC